MSGGQRFIEPAKIFRDFLEGRARLDGRSLESYRDIVVNTESFLSSCGSSSVKLGNTNIICGIRAELSKPRETLPYCGYVVPNIDLNLASAMFLNTSAKSQISDTLSLLLFKALVHFECVNLTDLCVQPGKLVWVLYIDIICLEFDGGFLEAAMVGCIQALKNFRFPDISSYKKDLNGYDKKTELIVNAAALINTFSIFNRVDMNDPTLEEETMSSGLYHCGLYKSELRLLQKRGKEPTNIQNINISIKKVLERSKDLDVLINGVNK